MSEALFQLGQKALILNEKLEVLMVGSESHDDPSALYWDLPGGRVDESENDLTVALDREVLEELEIEVDVHELLTLSIARSANITKVRIILAVYHCSIKKGEPKPSNEVKDFKWVPLDSVPVMPDTRYSENTIAQIKNKLEIN